MSWVRSPVDVLILDPSNATLVIGNSQTLTATIRNQDGDRVPGITVRFAVSGVNPNSGSEVTDSDGQAAFDYIGKNTGTDTVTAYADANGNDTHDSNEPSATASVTWKDEPGSSPSTPLDAANPARANPDCTYFSETQHNLCGGFLSYWSQFGGLAVFGYPLTEEFAKHGVTVQYFERARFEWRPGAWPERYDVELGRLGAQVLASDYGVAS